MTFMRAFNQSGNVRDHERVEITEIDHAQMRFKRRERIISDLRLRRRHRGNERRLAGVRETNQPHVRQQLQFQLQLTFFTVAAFLVITRRAICRSRKVRIAKSAAATLRRLPALTVFGKVKQQFARYRIENLSSNRHADNDIIAFFSRSVAAFTVHAASSDVQRVVAQVQKRIHRFIGHQPHVAATSAVTSGWPTAGHELFAAKGSHAVSAVTSDYANFCAIDEHRWITNSRLQISEGSPNKNARPAESPSARASHSLEQNSRTILLG